MVETAAEILRKASNPKDVLGIRKVPRSTIPLPVLWELGVAMLEGALKYARHNYRAVGVRASVYYDACARHMDAWFEGEDTDPDSALNHITKAIATLVVLRDSMIRGNWVDDRPPRSKPEIMAELNAKVAKLIDKYPDPKVPFTQAEFEAGSDRVRNPGESVDAAPKAVA
jgi:hypothetical protein